MITNIYKIEKWYKYLQKDYPEYAKLFDDAYEEMENRAYVSLAASRNFIEGTMDFIGQFEEINELRHANKDENIVHTNIPKKLDILVYKRLISDKFRKEIKIAASVCNNLHTGYEVGTDEARIVFMALIKYAKWFVEKYGNMAIIDDQSIVKIKVCSNQKQCGRVYQSDEEVGYCKKCGAPLEEQEHVLENTPSFDVYELIGEEKQHVYRGNIVLDTDEIVCGRKSNNSEPDIDLSTYINCEENKNTISRKHLLVYKKGNDYVIKNISQDNYVIIEDAENGNEQGLRLLEGEEIKVLEDMDNIFVHETIRLNYKIR